MSVTYKTPVYRMTMNWKGAPMTTLESTGNAVRAPVEKAVRQSYGNNYSNSLLTVDDDGKVVVSDEFAVALNNSTGAGLTLYSEIDTIKNTYVSQANLAASVDGVAASLTLIATKSELGNYATVARVSADEVQLDAIATNISGSATVGGHLVFKKDIYTNQNDGTLLIGQTGNMYPNNLTIGNKMYYGTSEVSPKTITYLKSFTQASTTGVYLGIGDVTERVRTAAAGKTITF